MSARLWTHLLVKVVQDLFRRLLGTFAKPLRPTVSKVHGPKTYWADPNGSSWREQPVSTQVGYRWRGRREVSRHVEVE